MANRQLPVNQCPEIFELVKIRVYSWFKKEKNGVVWDKFGSFLDNFGVIQAQFDVVLDYFGNKKHPKTAFLTPKTTKTQL